MSHVDQPRVIKGNRVLVIAARDNAEADLKRLGVIEKHIVTRAVDQIGLVIGYVYDGTGEWFFIEHEVTKGTAAYHHEELEVLS